MADAVLEAMATARSMRWLKDDPVDRELLERLVWAGTRASNPNNTQLWDFVVVTSPEVKQQVRDAIVAGIAGSGAAGGAPPSDPTERRTAQGAKNLLATMHQVPALIFICAEDRYPAGAPVRDFALSAIHAAAQNMLVAARALGLGAAFTTFHRQAEPEIRMILQIPDDRIIGVTMPVGWPARPFGPLTRRPVREVLHFDGW